MSVGVWEPKKPDRVELDKLKHLLEVFRQAGETSPVIYLVRILRSRDAFTPELRSWIKRHTDNRYLPYGPAL